MREVRHLISRRRRKGVPARLIPAAILLTALAGCGSGNPQTVAGTVTLDQRPLEQGYINFRPVQGATGPTVGSPIEKGRYTLPKQAAPLVGKFRIEITAAGKTGRKQLDDSGRPVEAEEQILPARYNRQSTLEAELKPGAANQLDFSVASR